MVAHDTLAGRSLDVLTSGQIFAEKYRIVRRIGSGGMGTVYEAQNTWTKRLVALKVLRPELAADESLMRRFVLEAQAATAIEHPNIVEVLDMGQAGDSGTLYIVHEYLSGPTLRDHLDRGERMTVEEAIDIAVPVMGALMAAHALGVVHRDVKPENIVLVDDESSRCFPKLIDFGISKLVGEGVRGATESGVVIGTPRYMSPEQMRGSGTIDSRSDIWAIGVVLYEMLAGCLPFDGESAFALAEKILATAPTRLECLIPSIPLELADLIHRALAPSLEERIGSMAAFIDELVDCPCLVHPTTGLSLRHRHREALVLRSPRRVEQMPRADELLPPGLSRKQEKPNDVVTRPGKPRVRSEAEGPEKPITPPARKIQHNLPAPGTALIGRERELHALLERLRRADVRLLTMVGAGGSGKTRLALEAAATVVAAQDLVLDGVFFVSLAMVSNVDLIGTTIAKVLGVRPQGDGSIFDAIEKHLEGKSVLLVLDNFEQLVKGASQIVELLARCPMAKVLVTSRALLRVTGEHELQLPPLQIPERGRTFQVDELSRFDAIRLFVERAKAARPAFELTPSNAAAVAEICRRLDGLPLALELAAARIRVLSPEAVLARLQQRLVVVTGGAQDLPRRQQTLRDAIAWSYDLLAPGEQRLLRVLSVFVGGWTVPMAEACTLPAEAPGVLDATESLLTQSVIIRSAAGPTAEPRFGLLETIREFAREQLVLAGEAQSASRQHAAVMLHLAESVELDLFAGPPMTWLRAISAEQENIRAAVEWSVADNDAELGLRLVGALWGWYHSAALWREGHQWAERVLALPEAAARTRARARALFTSGYTGWSLGEYEKAHARLRASLEISREVGDARGATNAGTLASLASFR